MRPTEPELAGGARSYLEHLIQRVREHFGTPPLREQLSVWMVPTGPGTWSGKEFRREVIDRTKLDFHCQSIMGIGSLPQARLADLLDSAGIPRDRSQYQFLLPLVRHWLASIDPLSPSEDEFHSLLTEFCRSVLDRRIVARRADALEFHSPIKEQIRLDDCVVIRGISAEELWQLGDRSESGWPHPWSWHLSPFLTEDLAIVDIVVHREALSGDQGLEVNTLGETVLIGLRLVSGGFFRTLPLGQWTNYGLGALGRMFQGEGIPQRQGMGGAQYVLDATLIARLTRAWPSLRRIVESEQHYLRLPAQKLLEGGRRVRDEDAVIDYSIGLESLLIADRQPEMAYRLALRGATIQCWNGGDRKGSFEALKRFYKIRSRIVHGDKVEKEKVAEAKRQGEEALRNVWWWYFENAAADMDRGIALVDDRICG